MDERAKRLLLGVILIFVIQCCSLRGCTPVITTSEPPATPRTQPPPVVTEAPPVITEAPPADTVRRIGNVTTQKTFVELQRAGAFSEVGEQEDLFDGDGVRVSEGGACLLNIGSSLALRLLNDTTLGGVTVQSAEGTPLDVQLFLEEGGLTGGLIEPGAHAAFTLPDNSTINIFGTTFLIAYDPDTSTTTAVNFEGSVGVETPGAGRVRLPSGWYMQVIGGSMQQPVELPPDYRNPQIIDRMAYKTGSYLPIIDALVTPPVQTEAPPIFTDNGTLPFPGTVLTNIETIPLPWQVITGVLLLPTPLPPQVYLKEVYPNPLWVGDYCPDTPPYATVVVAVDAPGGVASVVARWSFQGQSYETPLEFQSDGTWTAALGPVQPYGDILISVIAVDKQGYQGETGEFAVTVNACIG